jgi:hypothetical protein
MSSVQPEPVVAFANVLQTPKRQHKDSKNAHGPNWTNDENVLLSKRWISTTEDPEIGKDQKRDQFWEKVSENIKDRSGKSCQKQFQRMAQAV